MMSKEWDKERDAMSEAWYLPESKQEPVAVVGSGFSLLWINRGHFGVNVGDFLYTSPPQKRKIFYDDVDNYYEDIQKHKEECESDFREQQSEEKWYANSLGDE